MYPLARIHNSLSTTKDLPSPAATEYDLGLSESVKKTSIATSSYSLDVKDSTMTKTNYEKGVDYVEVDVW